MHGPGRSLSSLSHTHTCTDTLPLPPTLPHATLPPPNRTATAARLYRKAKDLAAPFAYEQYRAQRVAAKVEEERKSRIGLVRKLPKVSGRGGGNEICIICVYIVAVVHGLLCTCKCVFACASSGLA